MTDKIDIYNLQNGFTCCVRQCDYYPNFVTMALVVKAGSLCESVGQRGIAHVLEHLLMSFWTFDLYKDLKYRTKAYTDFNETIFYIKCPASETYLNKCIKILMCIAKGEFLNEKFFSRAKEDVLKEIKEESGKRTIANVLLKDSGYDHYYALGNKDDILQMGYRDAISFFERFYSAKIMSLVVVGDLADIAKLKQYIRKLFVDVQSFSVQIARKKMFIPEYKNRIEYIQTVKDDINSSEINIVLKISKDAMFTKESIVKTEIIENIALEIIILELKSFLDKRGWNISIEHECKELDIYYKFYTFKIKTKFLCREYAERIVFDIKSCIDMQLCYKDYDKKITDLLNEYKEIEYDSNLYYKMMGMHQMLLECIDMFILEKPVIMYEEKYALYNQVSRKIKKEDVYDFIELMVRGDKIFIANL